jgi:hypothetical protein
MFPMTRIEPPEWAMQPTLQYCGVTVAEYKAIRQYREELLRAVHAEVEAYLNDPQLVAEGDEEGFPHRRWLTGTYYLGDEWYEAHREPTWFQISIDCRCLSPPIPGVPCENDYLGLNVWLKCVPGRWDTFEVCGNTDSSAI